MKCEHCTKKITTTRGMKNHIKKFHPEKLIINYKCEICEEGFEKYKGLTSHIKKHKNIITEKEYFNKYLKTKCKYCDCELKHESKFEGNFCSQSHKISFNKEKQGLSLKYKCEICNSKYENLRYLGHHISNTHKDINIESYYNNHINKQDIGECLWCNKQTSFISLTKGYTKFCYNKDCNVKWHNKYQERHIISGESISNRYKENPELFSTKIEYWIKKGYTEKEAKKRLSERQTTFSKDICIKNHGKKKGLDIWTQRQEKWQNNLKSKPEEEIREINKKKMMFSGYSNKSQEIFWEVYLSIKEKYKNIYFATLDSKTKEKTKINNEYIIFTKNRGCRLLDFYIKDINKCIEYDGTYWHGEGRGNKTRDEKRENEILEVNPNMKILHIKEKEHNDNKEETIQKCLRFINES